MTPRDELLQNIRNGLTNRLINESDLRGFLVVPEAPAVEYSAPEPADKVSKKLSIIDVLFYLAGLIFYAALMVMVVQVSADTPILRTLITLGVGLLIWIVTYILGTQPQQNDTRKGLVNSMMLTGSLAVCSGGFFAAYQVVGNTSNANWAYAAALTMLLLGIFHLAFDMLLRHVILIVLGVLFIVNAFPVLATAVLVNNNVPVDVWAVIGIITGFLLAYGGRLASRSASDRSDIQDSFASLGSFVVLSSIYGATFSSSAAILWELLLPLTIYAAFYVSIKRRNKQFLLTGSLFLVVFLITIAFKYFSGLGAAFSLMLSAISLLATAFVATSINKRYIR